MFLKPPDLLVDHIRLVDSVLSAYTDIFLEKEEGDQRFASPASKLSGLYGRNRMDTDIQSR